MQVHVCINIHAFTHSYCIFIPRHPDPHFRPSFRNILVALLEYEDSLLSSLDHTEISLLEKEEDPVNEIYTEAESVANIEEIYDVSNNGLYSEIRKT